MAATRWIYSSRTVTGFKGRYFALLIIYAVISCSFSQYSAPKYYDTNFRNSQGSHLSRFSFPYPIGRSDAWPYAPGSLLDAYPTLIDSRSYNPQIPLDNLENSWTPIYRTQGNNPKPISSGQNVNFPQGFSRNVRPVFQNIASPSVIRSNRQNNNTAKQTFDVPLKKSIQVSEAGRQTRRPNPAFLQPSAVSATNTYISPERSTSKPTNTTLVNSVYDNTARTVGSPEYGGFIKTIQDVSSHRKPTNHLGEKPSVPSTKAPGNFRNPSVNPKLNRKVPIVNRDDHIKKNTANRASNSNKSYVYGTEDIPQQQQNKSEVVGTSHEISTRPISVQTGFSPLYSTYTVPINENARTTATYFDVPDTDSPSTEIKSSVTPTTAPDIQVYFESTLPRSGEETFNFPDKKLHEIQTPTSHIARSSPRNVTGIVIKFTTVASNTKDINAFSTTSAVSNPTQAQNLKPTTSIYRKDTQNSFSNAIPDITTVDIRFDTEINNFSLSPVHTDNILPDLGTYAIGTTSLTSDGNSNHNSQDTSESEKVDISRKPSLFPGNIDLNPSAPRRPKIKLTAAMLAGVLIAALIFLGFLTGTAVYAFHQWKFGNHNKRVKTRSTTYSTEYVDESFAGNTYIHNNIYLPTPQNIEERTSVDSDSFINSIEALTSEEIPGRENTANEARNSED